MILKKGYILLNSALIGLIILMFIYFTQNRNHVEHKAVAEGKKISLKISEIKANSDSEKSIVTINSKAESDDE